MAGFIQTSAVGSGGNDDNEPPQDGAAQERSSTEGLWNKKQVAEYLGVTERRVRTLVERGDLPQGVKIRGQWWWDPEVIRAFKQDLPQQDADDDINM